MNLDEEQRALWASAEVQDLFARILDLPEPERADLLRRSPPPVARLVEEMLAANAALGVPQAFCW